MRQSRAQLHGRCTAGAHHDNGEPEVCTEATSDLGRVAAVRAGGLRPLVEMAKSTRLEVQRASGALDAPAFVTAGASPLRRRARALAPRARAAPAKKGARDVVRVAVYARQVLPRAAPRVLALDHVRAVVLARAALTVHPAG